MKHAICKLTLPLLAAATILGSCSSNDEPVIPLNPDQGSDQTPGDKGPGEPVIVVENWEPNENAGRCKRGGHHA